MGPPTVDAGGALALAQAGGVEPGVALELIAAAANGVLLGAADRDREKQG